MMVFEKAIKADPIGHAFWFTMLVFTIIGTLTF